MNEYRISIMEGRDLDEVCTRLQEAGHEVLARFHVFGVCIASSPSSAVLRALDGVRSVEKCPTYSTASAA